MGSLFITSAAENPFFFCSVIVTVVISIVLHELAHGWMALRLGDPTPQAMGRMTGNPLVHMGPWSLLALFIAGIAWGQMPIDPGRLRGKFAEALVAVAGPVTNLLLAAVGVVGLTVCLRLGFRPEDPDWRGNLVNFLVVFGYINLLLMLFNLMPVPPLDGSHIMANFSDGYARAVSDPAKRGVWMLAFVGVFVLSSRVLVPAAFNLHRMGMDGLDWVLRQIGV
ncbi:MAG: site-2 protease family protein [Planctomycetota bacterium]